MPEQKTPIRLETAHVLFIDIVGYSKRSIDQQQAAIDKLAQLVPRLTNFKRPMRLIASARRSLLAAL